MHNLIPEQTDLLTRLSATRKDGEFLRSYLLVGAQHLLNADFVHSLAQLFICENSACNSCKSCRLLSANTHPDVHYITNHESNTIKIDSIRELQTRVTTSLAVAKYKLVIIKPADKLNIQAASALLKILEEPPEHTIFILLAEQLSSIPVTVISRCHKYFMHDYSLESFDSSYLDLANYYAEGDERYILMQKKQEVSASLLALVTGNTPAGEITAQLQDYKLENVLWFLYLLTAEALRIQVAADTSNVDKSLVEFANIQDKLSLYQQLDKLNQSLKLNLANVTLNNALAIENILLGYKNVS